MRYHKPLPPSRSEPPRNSPPRTNASVVLLNNGCRKTFGASHCASAVSFVPSFSSGGKTGSYLTAVENSTNPNATIIEVTETSVQEGK